MRLFAASIFLTVALSGCGGGSQGDGMPSHVPVDPDSVPNAVPRVEPPSRYGNPRSYVVRGKRYSTLQSSKGYRQRGGASWYGTKFHGRRTSSGEPYDMFAMTAAHKSLPLPTYVAVTNLANGRQVVVRVNDRGPFHGDRIIDLSYTAAAKLDMLKTGTARVEVVALDPRTGRAYEQPTEARPVVRSAEATATKPSPQPVAVLAARAEQAPLVEAPATGAPRYYVQAGAFSSLPSAEALRQRLAADAGERAFVSPAEVNGALMHRVRIGPMNSVQEADRWVSQLRTWDGVSPRIVSEPCPTRSEISGGAGSCS